MSVLPDRSQNQLLACLPHDQWERMQPLMEKVSLPSGQALYESDTLFRYVYFPLQGIVALHGLVENGDSSLMALVGKEGVVGVSSFMGGKSMSSNATVFGSGRFLRIRAPDLLQEFENSRPLMHLLLRYTQAMITQMAQTSVCNRHHSVDHAFSRLLLMSLDRSTGDELLLTHEAAANWLGVRREGVSLAAMRLQRKGLISYGRGHLQVLDREGLKRSSCECHGVIKTEYDRLLPMLLAV